MKAVVLHHLSSDHWIVVMGSHDTVLGTKASLVLIQVGENKSFHPGNNRELFCDTVGKTKIILNLIHFFFQQAKLV